MTPAALADCARQWLAAGRPAVVVWVEAARGSVPREAGARMLVAADETLGTVGGGHLELKAVQAAQDWLRTGQGPSTLDFALGPSLGQCCGGTVRLRLAPLAQCPPADWAPPAPRFQLMLYGAGHVGRALVHLLEGLECRVQWVDEREAAFPAGSLPAHIERIEADPAEAEVDRAPSRAFHLVMTHSHALDLRIVHAILSRGEFGFLGLIGSATKRARFERQLRERGIPPERLARLVCPIGLPGIEGKAAEVIAVSVAAQLLQLAPPAPAGESQAT